MACTDGGGGKSKDLCIEMNSHHTSLDYESIKFYNHLLAPSLVGTITISTRCGGLWWVEQYYYKHPTFDLIWPLQNDGYEQIYIVYKCLPLGAGATASGRTRGRGRGLNLIIILSYVHIFNCISAYLPRGSLGLPPPLWRWLGGSLCSKWMFHWLIKYD